MYKVEYWVIMNIYSVLGPTYTYNYLVSEGFIELTIDPIPISVVTFCHVIIDKFHCHHYTIPMICDNNIVLNQ